MPNGKKTDRPMKGITNLILIIISAINISVADAIIKHSSTGTTFMASVCNPWAYVAYLLYFIEIWLSVIIFNLGGGFTIYTNLFMIFYCIFCILLGHLVFHDVLTVAQMVGIVLGLVASVLLCA